MHRINDNELLETLYNKYKIKQLFSTDIKKDLFLVKFKRGQLIQQTGDPVKTLYFVVDGSVKVNSVHENGKSKLICIIKAFDMLGDIEIFAGMDYVNDIVALKDTYCLGLNLEYYRDILLQDKTFTSYMAKSMARIVLKNNQSSSFNMLYSLETRVATYILLSAKDKCFQENLTYLAEQMATSYRHLHRVLSGLCEKGMLRKEGRVYRIIDEERLKSIGNDSIAHI